MSTTAAPLTVHQQFEVDGAARLNSIYRRGFVEPAITYTGDTSVTRSLAASFAHQSEGGIACATYHALSTMDVSLKVAMEDPNFDMSPVQCDYHCGILNYSANLTYILDCLPETHDLRRLLEPVHMYMFNAMRESVNTWHEMDAVVRTLMDNLERVFDWARDDSYLANLYPRLFEKLLSANDTLQDFVCLTGTRFFDEKYGTM